MGAIRLCKCFADPRECLNLVRPRNQLSDRYRLLSQPAANCSEISFSQIIKIDPANRPHCVTVLHILRKLVRVCEDYAISRSLRQPKERRYLGIGEIGSLRPEFDLIRNECSCPCTKYAIDPLSIVRQV